MTSINGLPIRQIASEVGYYINLVGPGFGHYINQYTNPNNTLQGQFSTATWANVSPFSTIVGTQGRALLRDMGKTVVSSGRTFRKVQLIASAATLLPTGNPQGYAASVGSGGTTTQYATPSQGEDYLTGYIELGFSGTGLPAPVARLG